MVDQLCYFRGLLTSEQWRSGVGSQSNYVTLTTAARRFGLFLFHGMVRCSVFSLEDVKVS